VAARKRAPGGGRKRLAPGKAKSHVVKVRLQPGLHRALDSRAKQNKRDTSQEIRDALYYWLYRSARPDLHIGSLTSLIEALVIQIEEFTHKSWIDDPPTGVYVRKLVGDLIGHFAPAPNRPVTVPRAVRHILDGVIALADQMRREQNMLRKEADLYLHITASAGAPGTEPVVGMQGSVLAQIMRDLGGGLTRNRSRKRHK
jgi:hypothetical protein